MEEEEAAEVSLAELSAGTKTSDLRRVMDDSSCLIFTLMHCLNWYTSFRLFSNVCWSTLKGSAGAADAVPSWFAC